MKPSLYKVEALDETTWSAFAALVEYNDGIFAGCWCMGFHPEGVGKDTTAALNRERKLNRVRTGTAHAALVFDGDNCVGWCQFGEPNEVPRIKSRTTYEKGQTRPPDWRIACCYVGKGHRRQGVATAALAGALDLIAGLGGGRVEAYPEDAASVPAGFLFNGALSTYEKLGFVRIARSARTLGSLRRWWNPPPRSHRNPSVALAVGSQLGSGTHPFSPSMNVGRAVCPKAYRHDGPASLSVRTVVPGFLVKGLDRRLSLATRRQGRSGGLSSPGPPGGAAVSDIEKQVEKDLEDDPQVKQDAEKEAESQAQGVEQDVKKDL